MRSKLSADPPILLAVIARAAAAPPAHRFSPRRLTSVTFSCLKLQSWEVTSSLADEAPVSHSLEKFGPPAFLYSKRLIRFLRARPLASRLVEKSGVSRRNTSNSRPGPVRSQPNQGASYSIAARQPAEVDGIPTGCMRADRRQPTTTEL